MGVVFFLARKGGVSLAKVIATAVATAGGVFAVGYIVGKKRKKESEAVWEKPEPTNTPSNGKEEE